MVHPPPRSLVSPLSAALIAAVLLTGCTARPAPAPEGSDSRPGPTPTTPAAPPASGPVIAAQGDVKVVGLGDSVMAGTNCDCAGPLAAYAEVLEQRHPGLAVTTQNYGVDGDTTRDLRDRLARDSEVRAAVAQADVVVIIVGANDVLRATSAVRPGADPATLVPTLDQLRRNMNATLDAVQEVRGGRPATYLVAGYWNLVPGGGPVDLGVVSGAVTAVGNDIIEGAAREHGMTYVDLSEGFDGRHGELISDDRVHPNADGSRVIGRQLADATTP